MRISDWSSDVCSSDLRISLVEDEFASVSKISTGNPQDDFSVVNEPVRGDIYLSVPEGFARPALSFFATSKRGYVYKIVCRIPGEKAVQPFNPTPAISKANVEENGSPQAVVSTHPHEAAEVDRAARRERGRQ